jgi:hypothetical protein
LPSKRTTLAERDSNVCQEPDALSIDGTLFDISGDIAVTDKIELYNALKNSTTAADIPEYLLKYSSK